MLRDRATIYPQLLWISIGSHRYPIDPCHIDDLQQHLAAGRKGPDFFDGFPVCACNV